MFSYRRFKRQNNFFTKASGRLAMRLSNIQFKRALWHVEAGIAYRAVAALFGVYETTIARIHRRFNKTESIANMP